MLHKGYKVPRQIVENGNKVYGRKCREGGRSNWFYACKKSGCKARIKYTMKVWDFCRRHDGNLVHGMRLRGPLTSIRDKIVGIKKNALGVKIPLVRCAYANCQRTFSAREHLRLGHTMCGLHNIFDPGKKIARGRLATSAGILKVRGLIHHEYRIANGQIRYAVKCKNQECRGYISLGRFAKGLRYCKSCRPRLFGNYFLKDEILLPLLKKLKRVEMRAGWKYPRAWTKCAKYGCKKEVLIDRKNILFRWCDSCAASKRMLFGVIVRDDRLWSMRDKILGATKGKKRSLWRIACATSNCDRTILASRVVNDSKFLCCQCSHKTRTVPYGHAFYRLNLTAEERNLDCSLTYEQFVTIRSGSHCFYCQKSMTEYASKRALSLLDRVDVTKGYTKTNVVLCCPWCNRTKNATLTPDEMKIIGSIRARDINKATQILSQIAPDEHLALKNAWGKKRKVCRG